ncbi:MAG: zinc-dependent metalloprotease [Candidatus Aminicenantes bacterium]|nr:zinc-dependent metalloprotease [Candidatus Aminicenantes bacterium]MDH5384221.1 zinc-dependent metalloprotease [Candidatus Aminicenantes bacterium]MDH5743210.1 zinc-dependent metalloprotease [Candidatus Aminicenantes bacterium]
MRRCAFVLCFIIVANSFLWAQPQSISEKTSGMDRFPGYFTFYWDAKAGNIWLEIDKFDSEFLYVNFLPAGLGSVDVGADRNQLGGSRIVKFQRIGPKVLLIQPNYSFRALSDNPYERQAVEDAFAKSVIWGFKIEAEQHKRVLVDATSFFMRDAHDFIGGLRWADQGNYNLDLTRSAFYLPNTKNFLYNTEIETILTFTSNNPGESVWGVSPDARSITVRQHHSLIQLPDNDYKPRIYDPRSSFFGTGYMDFATPIDKPIQKRFICRHRLKKRDPREKISDPIKPIIYYFDRGVPEPVRSALIEGASWWNEAFEAIGYRNAFQVKLLPEGADPLDIRYNVINWVHRSSRGWSYGSSVIDPRTGKIIKGHIALGSLRQRQDFLIAQGLIADYGEEKDNASEMVEMALARIRQLSCHEVGHTLGLGHNYAASVNDRASVMDFPYPLVKINENGSLDLSDAYDTGIGEWDKVSIAYGYQDFPEGLNEKKELKAILDNAFSSGLYFLSGQDASSGSAHPLANLWDNGKNPVDELEHIMKIRALALDSFSEKRIPFGTPMATLEDVLVPVYLFHRYQVEAAASTLGGLYYNHTLRGDVQKNPEFVPAAEQRRALDALLKTIQPENLSIDEKILNLIPPRPPEYWQHRDLFPGNTGPTFDPLAAAENAAGLTMEAILHPQRAARMVEYHSRNEDIPGLAEVLDRLISSTWKTERKSDYPGEIQRVVDNVLLNNMMRLAVDEMAAPSVRAMASLKLDELKTWLNEKIDSQKDERQKAHYFQAAWQIKLFQDNPDRIKLKAPLKPPEGAPIGMDK